MPAHGSAVVTPAVAHASAGAIEHLPVAVVTNLARYLEDVKGPQLWVYGTAGDAPTTVPCRRTVCPLRLEPCLTSCPGETTDCSAELKLETTR